MANKNTKTKRRVLAKEFRAKRKQEQKSHNPPRKNSQKNFATYTNFPGFRKPKKDK